MPGVSLRKPQRGETLRTTGPGRALSGLMRFLARRVPGLRLGLSNHATLWLRARRGLCPSVVRLPVGGTIFGCEHWHRERSAGPQLAFRAACPHRRQELGRTEGQRLRGLGKLRRSCQMIGFIGRTMDEVLRKPMTNPMRRFPKAGIEETSGRKAEGVSEKAAGNAHGRLTTDHGHLTTDHAPCFLPFAPRP
jgi:hypothetical protein